jgi:hypothetical protein
MLTKQPKMLVEGVRVDKACTRLRSGLIMFGLACVLAAAWGCAPASSGRSVDLPDDTYVNSSREDRTEDPGEHEGEPESGASDVTVTMETGESPCLVTGTIAEGDRRYVVVDYVQLKPIPDGSYDFDIINENPALRTFEVTGDSYVGAFWLATELYGEQVMDRWYSEDPDHEFIGTPVALEDLQRAIDDGIANDYGYWTITVENGRVVMLLNNYQD